MTVQNAGIDTPWFRVRRLVRLFSVSVRSARGLSGKWAMVRCLIGWLRMRVGWPAAPRDVTVRLGDISVALDASRGEIASYWEIWHEHGYDDVPEFRPGEDACVVDVVANIGFFALRQARRARKGRVIAFEPSPSAFARLVRNVSMNGLSNVETVHAAVGSEQGIVRFLETTSSINSRVVNDAQPDAIDVDCVTLDESLDRMRVDRIDLLKIDTEGYERAVLAGALRTLPRVQRIILELHGDIASEKQAVDSLLEPFGFRDVATSRSLFYYDRPSSLEWSHRARTS